VSFVVWGRRSIARAARGLSVSRRLSVAFLCVAGLAASGCTTAPHSNLIDWVKNGFEVGPNFCPPSAPVASSWIDSGDGRVRVDPAQDCAWWTVFNDSTLNGLVETAYKQNLDLRAAGARILQSRAQRNIAIGNLFPQTQTVDANYVHAQISKNLGLPIPSPFNVWADGFNLSWELDFWGQYRRAVESADANLNASNESYGDTLVMLLSEVATNYVQARTYEQRLQYARQNVEIQKRTLGLAEARWRTGRSTELDVRQARTSLSQTEALIPPLVAGRRQAGNELCVLLGTPIVDLAAEMTSGPIPSAAPEVAIGVPADLLRRRPDVRRAEQQVAAQSAQIGIAEADLYPQLAVNAFVGFIGNDFRQLFESSSYTGLFFPSLTWKILNYGRVTNNIKLQDAKLDETVYQYQQSVLNANREAEDALVGFLQAQQQAAQLENAVRDAQRSVELVTLQFEGGITDFNRVFQTQTTLVNLQDQLATTRGNIALDLIQLYKALGGGWLCFCDARGMPAAPEVQASFQMNGPQVLPAATNAAPTPKQPAANAPSPNPTAPSPPASNPPASNSPGIEVPAVKPQTHPSAPAPSNQ
jgi:NodT family efflux transporter outer membrane factor (OMF) lipoprotein